MKVRTVLRGLVIATVLGMLAALLPQMGAAAPKSESGRYLVRARSAADYAGLRAKAVNGGRPRAARSAAGQHDGGQRAGGRPPQPGRGPAGAGRRHATSTAKATVEEPQAAPNLTVSRAAGRHNG